MKDGLLLITAFSAIATWSQAQAGVVTFTFDDSRLTQYENAFRIMNKYGLPGTMFAVPSKAENVSPGEEGMYMSWSQLKELYENGWDIQSHTYSHRNMVELNDFDLNVELLLAKLLLEARLPTTSDLIASPYGSFNDSVLNSVKEYYTAHFRAWGGNKGFNKLSDINLYDIGRYEVKYDYTFEEVCGIIAAAAVSEDSWLVLEFHQVMESQEGDYILSTRMFEEIVSCTAKMQDKGLLSVKTAKDVVSTIIKEGE